MDGDAEKWWVDMVAGTLCKFSSEARASAEKEAKGRDTKSLRNEESETVESTSLYPSLSSHIEGLFGHELEVRTSSVVVFFSSHSQLHKCKCRVERIGFLLGHGFA